MTLAVLLLALAVQAPASASARDDALRGSLQLAYAGETDGALARLAESARGDDADPMGVALLALVLAWKIEQRPDSLALDKDLHQAADRATALADAQLRADPRDARALLARGAAHGARSRLHLFRAQKREAARSAVKMRADLLEVLRLEPDNGDALFGLGLYDYYADVLPRMTKLLRFLAGMPGGDRERGLERIREAERTAFFYSTEATVQLFVIDAYYEKDADRALERIQRLHGRYPRSPHWALLLARHQCFALGLYAESAGVARGILAASERGEAGFGGAVAAMARVSLGESLLLDLRLAEARRALLPVKDGIPEAAWVGPTARLLLGRSLELEGDREAALAHYRRAAESSDRGVKRRAREALASPMSSAEVRATHLVGEARRARDDRNLPRAIEQYRKALLAWPDCREARLRVAEAEIDGGHGDGVRGDLEDIADDDDPQPPWIRPWARLLLGRIHDLAGERSAALREYELVSKSPSGVRELRGLALEGLKGPYAGARAPSAGPGSD